MKKKLLVAGATVLGVGAIAVGGATLVRRRKSSKKSGIKTKLHPEGMRFKMGGFYGEIKEVKEGEEKPYLVLVSGPISESSGIFRMTHEEVEERRLAN